MFVFCSNRTTAGIDFIKKMLKIYSWDIRKW